MGDNNFLINEEISLVSDEELDLVPLPQTEKGEENDDDDDAMESVDIDEFLRRGGECGRYQIMIEIFLMIALIPSSYFVMIFYYIGYDPPWKCKQDNNNNGTLQFQTPHLQCNETIFEHNNNIRCKMNRTDWEFAYKKITLVTEFNLICGQSWLDALSGSIVFVGWGIGIIITGYLSDRFGRKKVMFPCMLLALIFLFLHAFVQYIWHLILLRFLLGIAFSSPALNGFIMVVELVGPSKRAMATFFIGLLWPVGALFMTIKAIYIDNWRVLVISCSAPYIVGLLFAFCIPESVRWLNLKGHTKEAEKILLKASKINKRVLPPMSLKPPKAEKRHGKKATYSDLFKRWKLARSTLAQGFIWFTTGMTYYTLNWAFADLGGDMYLNFMLSFLVEMPANVIAAFSMQRIGRRRTAVLSYCLAVVTCLLVACVPKTDKLKGFRVACGLSGKFAITVGFAVIYMWSSEIYSTVLRSQGMGINIVTSRAGAASSNFIKELDKIHPAAPFGLLTGCCLITTFLCFLLPETVNRPTRETLDDMLQPDEPIAEMRAIYSLNGDTVKFKDNMIPRDGGSDDVLADEREDENDPLIIPDVQVISSEIKS